MLRYLMISLLTLLTIILLTRSLVGATQYPFIENVGARKRIGTSVKSASHTQPLN